MLPDFNHNLLMVLPIPFELEFDFDQRIFQRIVLKLFLIANGPDDMNISDDMNIF